MIGRDKRSLLAPTADRVIGKQIKMVDKLTKIKAMLCAGLLSIASLSLPALAGFSISGTQLLDGNGQLFVMRGINHAHTWFPNNTGAIADIARTGANTVRVVLSNGQTWNKNASSDVQSIISLCKQNKLICVLEVHDVTGVGDSGGNSSNKGTISGAADYWVSLAGVLKGQEDFVIINVANEPTGNGVSSSKWVGDHQDAIRTIRNAGLTHTIMVDAANWGQDWEEIMLNNAAQVASADAQNNTLFSVHMYQVYQDYNKIYSYVTRFLNKNNVPLVVGEFGDNHQGDFVDADSIMQIAEDLDVGYMGWSWSGNGSCCSELDISLNFNANNLSSWGNRLINSVNGIKATSVLASVYTGMADSSSSPAQSSSSSSVSSSASVASSSSSASTTTAGSLVWWQVLFLLGLAVSRYRHRD